MLNFFLHISGTVVVWVVGGDVGGGALVILHLGRSSFSVAGTFAIWPIIFISTITLRLAFPQRSNKMGLVVLLARGYFFSDFSQPTQHSDFLGPLKWTSTKSRHSAKSGGSRAPAQFRLYCPSSGTGSEELPIFSSWILTSSNSEQISGQIRPLSFPVFFSSNFIATRSIYH